MMIRVAIVDDQQVNRITVRQNLAEASNIKIVLECNNGDDFFERMGGLTSDELPHLVLMDIDMPVMNGIEAIAAGTIRYPQVRFLVLTVFDDDEKIFQAIRAGASGYLLKDDPSAQLIEAIRNAIEYNSVPMSPAIARKTLMWMRSGGFPESDEKSSAITLLTDRETEILKLMVEGKDYKQIAEELFISPFTVRTHTSKIYEKLHVNSKAQAINMANKFGIR